MQIRRALCEFIDCLRIDRRDRAGKADPLSAEGEPHALADGSKWAGDRNPGKAPALDLARKLQRGQPLPGLSSQVQGRQLRAGRIGH
jgi:hypothetical protein